MSIIDSLLKKFQDIPGLVVSAKHIDFLRDVLKERENEIEKLKAEYAKLQRENDQMKLDIASLNPSSEFIRHNGLLWRGSRVGGCESSPYCPTCSDHPIMFEFPPGAQMFWNCSKCDMTAPYSSPPNV